MKQLLHTKAAIKAAEKKLYSKHNYFGAKRKPSN